MIDYRKTDQIMFGGDYNPEQWPEETWPEDMRLLKRAGINILTVNVFSWAAIQPSEDSYDFERLDRIVKLASDNDMKLCLATGTGAMPAWMAQRHPDILRTDNNGIRRKFGGRENFCPNSPTFLKYAPALAQRLAGHYRDNKDIWAWHISNEYSGRCFCDNCEKAFRSWLKDRYGTVERLNQAWYTAFWGHTYYDFEEVVVPDLRSEEFENGERSVMQGQSIDYRRFWSDSLLKAFILERDAVRKEIPDAVITTNMMAFYKDIDYFRWAKEMDFVSWDSYPSNGMSYAQVSMPHDLMRGVNGGEPFAMLEQTPSVTNWQAYNALKRPGVMRLQSYQAVAHGSDTVMFFQMKQGIGNCEKLHGAVIEHCGHGDTRVFRETEALGAELKNIGKELLGTHIRSDIAMIFDWDNWWAAEYSAGPSRDLKYIDEFRRFYEALRNLNFNVDIVEPSSELKKYHAVIAPVWYMVKSGDDENIREFVKDGGVFITTFFSGIVQENDLIVTGGYPGRLRDILGIWVEETDALPEGASNSFKYRGREYPANIVCDLLHTEGAVQIDDSGYGSDFYRGFPVVTENKYGNGRAYYIASSSNADFYMHFLGGICAENGITPVMDVPYGVEAASRENDLYRYVFLMNQSGDTKKTDTAGCCTELISGEEISGSLEIAAFDVKILKYRKQQTCSEKQ